MPPQPSDSAHGDPPATSIERAFTKPAKTEAQRAKEKAALKRLLDGIDVEAGPAPKTPSSPSDGADKDSAGVMESLRERMEYRRQLKRARSAARKTFGVEARPSARKRAALMMGLGAMTLGSVAATGSSRTLDRPAIVAPLAIDATKQRVHAMEISVSDDFKQALIEEEGVRQTVYRDVAGYPTVGIGHLVRPEDGLRVGDTIAYDQVLDFLESDLDVAEDSVRRLVGDLPLYQHEFDALVDLVYNVGEGNVSAAKSPRLNAAIRAGDYESIADELHYHHAAGRKAKGLEIRSERRSSMFEEASYENPREA